MKVYIIGAGAVGTYFGELLGAGGAEITYAPRAVDDVTPVRADLAIVTVKAFDTPGAVETLRRALGEGAKNTTFFTPQNGVGNEELLAEAFGADNIVSCALTVPLEKNAAGKSVAANSGGVAVAPVGAQPANWLVAAFERAGMAVRVCDDYRAMKWSKLALNIVANASCAILDVLPEKIVAVPALFDLELRAVAETFAVMRALHLRTIDLPRYPIRALYVMANMPRPIARAVLGPRFAGARGVKLPSLLLDVRAGRRQTEVGVLNGAIALAGARCGVPVPVNAALSTTLSSLAAGKLDRAAFRDNPEALLARVGPSGAPA